MIRKFILGAALALAACTTGQPQATFAALEVGLTAAESAAYAYGTLPLCGSPGAPAICSSPIVVSQLVGLDAQAYAAVLAARTVVAAGGNPDLTAATAALAAFQTTLSTLPKGN